MTSLHETAYPRLKAEPTPKELAELYTPTAAEREFVASQVRQSTARLAFLIHLKLFQRLGYFVRLTEVPAPILQHIAQASGLRRLPPRTQLETYDDSGAQRRHIKLLRNYLNVRAMDEAGKHWLRQVAETAADTKHSVEDIINVMLEELVRQRYELPGFSTLERIAMTAREKVNTHYCQQIAQALSSSAKLLIDGLLVTAEGEQISPWQALKREPKKPTNKEVRNYLQHIQHLHQLAADLPPVKMPAAKYKYFRTLARALDAAEMAELRPVRRYALAVIFIRSQYSKTLDDLAELFLRMVGNLENHAQQQRINFGWKSTAPMVRKVLKGIRELHPAQAKQATPLQLHQLEQVEAWLSHQEANAKVIGDQATLIRSRRDKALLLLGFWRAFRSDELCRLQLENSEIVPGQGLELYLPRSKGDRKSDGTRYKVPALKRLCPVIAYQRWMEVVGRSEGPVFCAIDRWGKVSDRPLHPNSVIPLLRDLLRKAGIEGSEQYSSHSLRRGFATWASMNGWDMKALMTYVGWHDVKSALRYVDAAAPFGDTMAPLPLLSSRKNRPA